MFEYIAVWKTLGLNHLENSEHVHRCLKKEQENKLEQSTSLENDTSSQETVLENDTSSQETVLENDTSSQETV